MNLIRNFLITFSNFDIKILKYSILNKSEYESIGLFYIFQFLFLFIGEILFFKENIGIAMISAISICLIYFLYKKKILNRIENLKPYSIILIFIIAVILSFLNSIPFILTSFEYEINYEYYKYFNIKNLSQIEELYGIIVFINHNEAKHLLIIIFSSIFLIHLFVFIYPLILKINSKTSTYSKFKTIYEQFK